MNIDILESMGMENVASYIISLRQSRGLSRARLADKAGTTEMSILRIEKQGQEPSGPLLVRIIQTLGGSWDIVTKLLNDNSEDALEKVLTEVKDTTPEPSPDFIRFLDLVAEGVSPQEAAQRALHRP